MAGIGMVVGVGLLLVVGVHRMAPALFFVFFLLPLLIHSAEEEGTYFPDCPGMSCGSLGHLFFPFTNATRPECGLIKVGDCDKPTQKIQFQGGGRWYDTSFISPIGTTIIHDQELKNQLKSSSCDALKNLTLPISAFWYFRNIITMYKCNRSLSVPLSTDFNYTKCNHVFHYNHIGSHLPSLPSQCSVIQLPLEPTRPINADLFSFLTADFFLDLSYYSDCVGCKEIGGQCRFYHNGTFQCVKTKTGRSNSMVKKLALGIGGPIFIFCLLFCILQGHCKRGGNSSSNKSKFFWNKKNQNHQTVEVFLRENQWLAPKRYSYSDIKKMTHSFKDKLGQGGYGGVYKGKLRDGPLVAVKVLNKSKGDGEEFVNEVASISRTSHVNIVTLLGFCFQGSKRALIYEFMPNGSLEKFIYDKKQTSHLGWEVLYQIAIGIARGLEYLHRGCSTRILHFDIKPHNILLDENFVPKVSDFGLAKLCPENGSIVSMMGARGTVGYIAPEVFCRNIGGVSHKSDVYSYGMMILEMVGGRKNIDVGVDHTSEIYFPHWIYRQIEQGEELGPERVKNEEENEKANKMILVGLWCIQTDPSIRPPMARVVEMLQGSLELLQIPPKPFLCSPPRPVVDSSTSLSPAIMTS